MIPDSSSDESLHTRKEMPIVKYEDEWEDEEVETDEEENYGLKDEDIYLQECIVELEPKQSVSRIKHKL